MTDVTTEEDLAGVIRAATGPLSIRGGATRGPMAEGTPLGLSGLAGVTLYEPGALTLVARAGTAIDEIDTLLAAENQRLAFEPPDLRALTGSNGRATLGGVMAANASGPRRLSVGAARDFALGVRFVDGSGNIVKNGGRVMKNVTGYDLVKLMCGACGTLGVLTEVALKVLPRPETALTLVLHGLGDAEAVAAMAAAMGSPYEVTGAAHEGRGGDARTLLRLEGFEASVLYRAGALTSLLARYGAEITQAGPEQTDTLWQAIRDASAFATGDGDLWRLSCKPSDAPHLVATAAGRGRVFDWAGGLIWLETDPGTDLRAALGSFDGHATLIRASTDTRARLGVFQPQAPGVARLSAGLRAKFDPRGILNAGLMEASA